MRLKKKNRKSTDHIHSTVYSKMKLLQPSRIHIENIKSPVMQQAFCSEIEHSI